MFLHSYILDLFPQGLNRILPSCVGKIVFRIFYFLPGREILMDQKPQDVLIVLITNIQSALLASCFHQGVHQKFFAWGEQFFVFKVNEKCFIFWNRTPITPKVEIGIITIEISQYSNTTFLKVQLWFLTSQSEVTLLYKEVTLKLSIFWFCCPDKNP